jgi:hypothetical protein
MQTHSPINRHRVRQYLDAIRAAVALHRNWIIEHGTDDDASFVHISELLPELDLLNGSEVGVAATWAGFPVSRDEDGVFIVIGEPSVQ